jgi:Bacterial Ig-like domain (group 3)/Integrin beta chain VWA domain
VLVTCVGVMAPMLAFIPASMAATPGVDPSSVTLTLAEGTSSHVSKVVHTPAIPPKPDVLVLADTTGSMGDTLSSLKTNLNSLVSQVQTAQPDAQFAVADYRDFDNCPADGYAYRLDQPVTANISAVQAAVNGYSAFGGCDTPEQQLNALFQIATDNPPVGWRSGSTRIVAWFGDSSGHDPSFGHTLSNVIAALQAAHIEVIAVPINTGSGDGLDSTGQASAITSATGGSLVASSAPGDVTNAIVSGLKNLPVTVQPTTSSCDPDLTVSWNPTSSTVTSGNDATFDETIAVASTATPGTNLSCTVAFLLNGQPAGSQFNESISVTVPKHDAVLTVNNASSDFHDPGTVSATLRDASTSAPIAGQPVSFSLNGTESCMGTTLTDGSVSCSVTPTEPAGTYPLTATFAGDAQHNATTASASYAVTLEETTLKYTGPTVLAANGATLTAVLTEDGVTPINGRTVTIKLSDGTASQTCTGTTDTNGNASCTISPIPVALGNDTITATFAGDSFYRPSSDTVKAIVFAFPTTGAFVVGDKTSSGKVDFWGSQWTKNNVLSGGSAPDAFKGFAATTSKPPANGNPWSTDPGNSPPPPSTVPSYMGVIVASQASQTGSTISGNTVHIVVVKTDPGYASDSGHRGTGTVVATFS